MTVALLLANGLIPVKMRYHGEYDPLSFIDGQVYNLIGYEEINGTIFYGIIDETDDSYLVIPDYFEIIQEEIPEELKRKIQTSEKEI